MKLKGVHILVYIAIQFSMAQNKSWEVTAWETSAQGKLLQKKELVLENTQSSAVIRLEPQIKFQKIVGFGGAFTESTTYLLSKLSAQNRAKILELYFSESGAKYSLCRTHINSCDFSLNHYAYANTPNDVDLKDFSIARDEETIIPTIKEAQKYSKNGFKLIASPWTAPIWMKDNNAWVGGKLKKEYYKTWTLYFQKYFDAYKKHNINFWGLTVENEPNGNGNNWESMLYSPEEMTDFVQNYLGPHLEKNHYKDIQILGYDQNRADLKKWVDVMFQSEKTSKYFAGTAVHWYESTYDYFPEALEYAHSKSPNKYLIQTEACIDAEVPVWKDDNWYWQPHATDWGFDWASEQEKYLHPKYVPVYRYAEDIIGCLNHWVNGWVDWNMVLDKQGGPNWFKNWCIAPIIVDAEKDEVYTTPLYYIMAHFSKFIEPNAHRIGFSNTANLQVTALENPNGSVVVIVLNKESNKQEVQLQLHGFSKVVELAPQSIQTIVFNAKQ
ncbi:glucosylceramidase [Flavobacterium croceum DSM 17960]|uniref:Glucosylceramidase n=1 Tax=Flavobacterium croceum DSM 17960 TaxID=1121886 RepID=A0A2S4N7Z0_9FLAO|nr:glycoside hydrolase family 30 protein [Flavobacterium croceum]POS01844.1 glucosylceramidase [Flavobacterium croceum DSM 17960]